MERQLRRPNVQLHAGAQIEPGGAGCSGSVGDYYWGSATGPSFWIDPQENW